MDADINFNKAVDILQKNINESIKEMNTLKKDIELIEKEVSTIKNNLIIEDEIDVEEYIMKTLIIPDIHCREFFIEPLMDVLKNKPNVKIVCLGDYLDGYPSEWYERYSGYTTIDYQRLGIENLQLLIDLKKKYNDRITLLMGNHDATYMISLQLCNCRADLYNYNEICDIFKNNSELFDICHEEIINNKKFIYSHAGIDKRWEREIIEEFNLTKSTDKDEPIECDKLNKLFHDSLKIEKYSDNKFAIKLREKSYLRGGYSSYGSIIWTDIRDFADNYIDNKPINDSLYNDVIQIVGHTQTIDKAISIRGKIYDLDVRQCFYIDNVGNIRYYNTNDNIDKK